MSIIQATPAHLEAIAPLFDQYRVFYQQPSDLAGARLFIEQRLATALMARAEDFARQSGAVRVILSTQVTNLAAQSLYAARGYQRDEMFSHYALNLAP